MDSLVVIAIAMALFIALLLSGAYIHTVLLGTGVVALVLLQDISFTGSLIGPAPFQRVASYTLSTVPVFILMAQFALRAGIISDIFYVVKKMSRGRKTVMGSLTVIAGGLLGAVSGSGAASSAAMGQVAAPELERSGYSRSLSGAIAAAAGSLSGVIPPSIILILYGAATETSIGDLFLASVIPGAIVIAAYIVIIFGILLVGRNGNDEPMLETAIPDDVSSKRIAVSMAVSACIVLVVFGGIYGGFVTPTEAGAVGAFATLLGAVLLGKASVAFFREALGETVKVTVMVMVIMIGALIFGRFISLAQIPAKLIDVMQPLIDRPALLLAVLATILFFLFMMIEGAAVILMAIPVMLPLIDATGVDLVWFGVFVGVICALGLITPPVGMSVFSVAGATGIRIAGMFRYTIVIALVTGVLMAVLLIAFPGLATWLPTTAQ